jgi:uncharacterized glyoxalase superfamily protein PhnB
MAISPIIPVFRYRDANAAIEFLTAAFGFEEHAVYRDDDGRVMHAELRFGDGLIMLGQAGDGREPDGGGVYVIVEDVDAHHDRAKRAGATITRELTDMDYGSREYGATDPEGNEWSFGTYQPS